MKSDDQHRRHLRFFSLVAACDIIWLAVILSIPHQGGFLRTLLRLDDTAIPFSLLLMGLSAIVLVLPPSFRANRRIVVRGSKLVSILYIIVIAWISIEAFSGGI